MATTMNPAIDYHELIHEDRIHGSLYRDPDIFEEEFSKIWYRSWVYVGHESEVPEPGDYRTKQIGRQPVIMVRDENGSVNLLLNRCAHRGNIVCQNERGNAHVFRCAYHGWTYSNRGDLLGATFVGAYGDSFEKTDYRLAKVPRVDSYRGLIFASMSPTGPTLAEHLGRVTEYLDAFIDFSPDGELEVRSGVQKAKYHGNWKMMAENSLEGNYHGHFIHQFIFSLNRQRQGGSLDTNNLNNEESPDKVVYLPGGHMVEDLAVSPMPMVEKEGEAWNQYIGALASKFGTEQTDYMMRYGAPLIFIFPNLIMIQSQIRVLQPVTPTETNVWYYPTLLKGAPQAVNTLRLRGHERSYGPGGFVSADDLEICERNQLGMEAQVDEWLWLKRGLHREKVFEDGRTSGHGMDENNLRGVWRHYKKVMSES